MALVSTDEAIDDLTEAELDDFPHGVIQLDRSGKILLYNRVEAELAHRTAESAIGLNFFTDVAPCTAVQSFEGRFRRFVATSGSRCEKFDFVFRFAWGDRQVGITLVRRGDNYERIYIVVNILELAG